MIGAREFVFGYGSLASAGRPGARLAVASLQGHVRVWDVAMDNRATVPGYKYYVDPHTAERPAVCVTFLDVMAAADSLGCVGFLLPVRSASELVALDRRERNYDRLDVTGLITVEEGGGALEPERVWTYVGKVTARERYARAAAEGRAVIQAAYRDGVEAAFAAYGLAERYESSTRPPDCPVRALTRVNDSSRT